ncbi:hypothetical protein H0H81_000013 [Sphagnurus paluster]|uniref:Uncharacterized protein n=1 Tax=Sphagnurus paluster TaxID=117069 RepID=A0A9P7K786_9AGAR|nr:hypothetical protein H0H81_000013 [Sphagnurus paluster]
MSDAAYVEGGCCAICCFSALQSWFNTKNWGAGGCCNSNSTSGCCGSCCGDSFNEDAFDRAVQEDLEKTRATDTAALATQPVAGQSMAIPDPSITTDTPK